MACAVPGAQESTPGEPRGAQGNTGNPGEPRVFVPPGVNSSMAPKALYALSDADLANWGMNPRSAHDRMQASQYDQVVRSSGAFGHAIQAPWVWSGMQGCIVLVSTAQSTMVSRENARALEERRIVLDPNWLYYEVYSFASRIPPGHYFYIA